MKRHLFPQSLYTTIKLAFSYFVKWLVISVLVGAVAGSAAALFLLSLDAVTHYRESHFWIIVLLPLGGLLIGLLYHYWGSNVVKGNNLLIEEFHSPNNVIPFKMAPLVLAGTLITHLLGGSAGREGTAVQMGGAIADQFTSLFRLRPADRKILLLAGISGGFAAVFGTPLAGAVFALELLISRRIRYEAIFPAFLTAVIADYTCLAWDVHHTSYIIALIPGLSLANILWAALAGIIFGLAAMLFSTTTHYCTRLFTKHIRYAPLRPFIGGAILSLIILTTGITKYIGLGIPTIVAAFSENMNGYDFLLKIAFTALTLGAGFKGGEVTPLFFIGAVLGNALVWFIPLPMALLAGMGFAAVFAGATNTPIACIVMGIELFGAASALYIAIACIMAYLFSGRSGIYSAQKIAGPKHHLYNKILVRKKVSQ